MSNMIKIFIVATLVWVISPTNTVFAAQEEYLTNTVVDTLNTPSKVTTLDLYGDLTMLTPGYFLPKSKAEKKRIADEKLEKARALALLEYEANKREPRTHQTRSDFENSATNYDQNGEIIIAAQPRTANILGTASVMNSGIAPFTQSGSQATGFVIVIMLILLVVLLKLNFLKKSRRYYQRPVARRRSYVVKKPIIHRNKHVNYVPYYSH